MKTIVTIIVLACIIYTIDNLFDMSLECWIIVILCALVLGLYLLMGSMLNY